jgi:membrane carboxypeptidase/penicillin-binding protein
VNSVNICTQTPFPERDAWTLRLGPSGSTAIWIGFDKPTAIAREPRLKSLLDEFVKRLGND